MTRLFLVASLGIFLAGCATVSYHPGDVVKSSVPGIYHEVRRGETLWSISKIYDVDLKTIIAVNRLPNASKIEVGQLILIPEVGKERFNNYAKGAKSESFAWPVRGTVVSYFGSTSNMVKNKGIDIRIQEGTKVKASRGGKITFASDHLKGYGKTIIINHLDGFETVYAYNKDNLIGVGEHVNKGDIIAKAGKTGRANRPTLHFEIRKKSKPQNPFYYLP